MNLLPKKKKKKKKLCYELLLGFKYLKDKMLLSEEKEISIKAMAQAIPKYTMSVFKLLNTQCDEMTIMVRKFWWEQTNDITKMAWLS